MLSRIEILFLASIFSFVLLSAASFAAINCSPCLVNNCVCAIENCASGILRIYSTAGCKTPTHEFTFSGSRFVWDTASSGTYYAQALCSDGQPTTCNSFTVRTAGTTTTFRETTTTIEEETSGADYSWIMILIGVLVVIGLVMFLFFRRKPQKSFETLYRKWGK